LMREDMVSSVSSYGKYRGKSLMRLARRRLVSSRQELHKAA
jgi:hypothetical protein